MDLNPLKIEFVNMDFNPVKIEGNESVDDPFLTAEASINSDKSNSKKCGEVFTENYSDFILICSTCKETFLNLHDFGEHLRYKHKFPVENEKMVKYKVEIIEEIADEKVDIPEIEKLESPPDFAEHGDNESADDDDRKLPADIPESATKMLEKSAKSGRKKRGRPKIKKEKNLFYRCEICLRLYSTRKYLKYHICKPRKGQNQSDVKSEEAHVILVGPNAEKHRKLEEKLEAARLQEVENAIKSNNDDIEKNDTKNGKRRKGGRKKTYTDAETYCDICDIQFSRKYRFRSHALKHETPPTALRIADDFMKCRSCRLTFTNMLEWRQHLDTHKKEKFRFTCTLCPKRFSERIVLQMHMNTHTGERPYMCDQCPMAFAHATNLSWHVKRVHLKLTPYGCKLCDRKFTKNYELTVHMRSHTGEKPYVCDVCGKGFILSGRLNDHRKTHTNTARIRKHRCQHCPQTFTSKSAFSDHIQIHSEDVNIKPERRPLESLEEQSGSSCY